jgi:valyl-tRNA synthetase
MLAALLDKTQKRLSDPVFRARAPPPVVAEAEAKAAELAERLKKLDENLGALGATSPV